MKEKKTKDKQAKIKQELLEQDQLKNVLDRLYNCRDLEISNLWQRSVFLSVFLILSFSAYGYICSELFLKNGISINKTIILNFISVIISSISIIFSIIWILMSKSSKAWYEVYENAISEFESNHSDILGIPEENTMGNMLYPQNLRKDSILSTNGGAFSPSRLNILLGQICLLIWVTVLLGHTFYNFNLFGVRSHIMFYVVLNTVIPFLTMICCMLLVFSDVVKSKFLSQ